MNMYYSPDDLLGVKYLTNLKKIILSCLRKGWLSTDPFAEIKLAKKEVEPDFLNDQELAAVKSKKISIQRLALVRYIFVFHAIPVWHTLT